MKKMLWGLLFWVPLTVNANQRIPVQEGVEVRLRRAPCETFWDIPVDQNVLGSATNILDAADIPVRELPPTRNSLLG
jgi:hypothetical protein